MPKLDELRARRGSLRGDLQQFLKNRDEAHAVTREMMTAPGRPSRRDAKDRTRADLAAEAPVADLENKLAKLERLIFILEQREAGKRVGLLDRLEALYLSRAVK